MTTLRTPAIVAAAAAALTALTAPTGAAAAERTDDTEHCVIAVDARPGQQPACFASFRAATSFATGTSVTGLPENPAEAIGNGRFSAALRGARADETLVTLFEHENFQGNSYTFTGNRKCQDGNGADFHVDAMPNGWNDRVSSFFSGANCDIELFEDGGFQGLKAYYVGNRSRLGAMNDATSSIKFH
ncbi:peptidase inhibitor family I36 protein [Streptomyces sp. NPDC002867]